MGGGGERRRKRRGEGHPSTIRPYVKLREVPPAFGMYKTLLRRYPVLEALLR